jgi:hypothetical protein
MPEVQQMGRRVRASHTLDLDMALIEEGAEPDE